MDSILFGSRGHDHTLVLSLPTRDAVASSLSDLTLLIVPILQQFRQPRNVRRDPARFVQRQDLRLHRFRRRGEGIDPRNDLAIGIAHDVATRHTIGSPGRGEAA